MIRFENIALQIRAFNEGDSEIEILSKEMEQIAENLEKMQEEQEKLLNLSMDIKERLEQTA